MILNIGIEVYIVIGAIVALFIFMMVIMPIIKFNQAKKVLMNYPNFKEYHNKHYDFTIETDEVKLFIKMVDVPKNSMITINSRDTWCLSYGGSSDPGKAYPNKKYLDEIKEFLKNEYKSDKITHKVILINSSTEKIVRYLNESELAVVKLTEKVYDYRIIQLTQIDEQIKVLGIK